MNRFLLEQILEKTSVRKIQLVGVDTEYRQPTRTISSLVYDLTIAKDVIDLLMFCASIDELKTITDVDTNISYTFDGFAGLLAPNLSK